MNFSTSNNKYIFFPSKNTFVQMKLLILLFILTKKFSFDWRIKEEAEEVECFLPNVLSDNWRIIFCCLVKFDFVCEKCQKI